MSDAPVSLRVAQSRSSLDARRGVVRLHHQLLESMGARAWDVVQLTGRRMTGAIAAFSAPNAPADVIYLDDVTIANCGVQPGGVVQVELVTPAPASVVELFAPQGAVEVPGPDGYGADVDPAATRFALLGKVVCAGDQVGLLPQDFTGTQIPAGTSPNVLGQLVRAFGGDWQQDWLLVTATQPDNGLVRVTMTTTVLWTPEPGAAPIRRRSAPPATVSAPVPDSLPGLEQHVASLRERLDLGFHHRDLLRRLGAPVSMGVLVSGPAGSGKRALVEAAAASVGADVVRLWGPALARIEPAEAVKQLAEAVRRVESAKAGVLLLEQVHEIAPRDGSGPLASVVLELVENLVGSGRGGVVCITDKPEATTPDLRSPGRLDHEIAVTLPDRTDRRRILEVQTRPLPLALDINLDDIAGRTPGFVAADIKALCHEAALRAAQRLAAAGGATVDAQVTSADFEAALEVVRPSALGNPVELGGLTLDDVGDMAETKRLLTEAVIWPLVYPETFERLGVPAPHGALLYGPPGCGKTFLVKAIAAEAAANFLSIRGAELLSKWVGESERGVRELFRRARSAAPAIIFFDEVDALAPQRGSDDNSATDRVVAQLLTELDGIEALRDVYVLAATNRPDLIDLALLRPGRLDTMIYVPPPDANARAAILRTTVRRMPIEPGIDLDAFGKQCEGYSAADLQALTREAAMSAMRENVAAPTVTAAHFTSALREVRPSLLPAQVAELERFASRHRAR